MKKILFMMGIIIVVILIYIKVNNKDNHTFSIGGNNSYYNYIYNDTRIEDIIYDIDNNIYIKDKHIQNIIMSVERIYIDLNGLYINNKSLYYIEVLISNIRKYTNKEIIICMRKENDILSKSLNNMIFNLKDKYDIIVER